MSGADLLHWQISQSSGVRAEGAGGMNKRSWRFKTLAILAFLCLLVSASCGDESSDQSAGNAGVPNQLSGTSAVIINKYLQATQAHEDTLRGASMQVDIDATVPRLKEKGTLRALRYISKVGQITYRELSFQGDSTIKQQVIARYLSAERQAQSDNKLAITPANYKFKYKGENQLANGSNVFVFQLTPHKKRVGLFRGEIWLDASTYLPVFEKGRLVKNPTVFFRRVDFERAYAIHNGVAIPERVSSTIDTRLIGVVQLDVRYSNFEQSMQVDEAGGGAASVAFIDSVN